MPFSATIRPTPPTSTVSSATPSSARSPARRSGEGANRVRSVPLPTTVARERRSQGVSVARSVPFWNSSAWLNHDATTSAV